MSDSVRPQRRQHTRLPRPWDSPDKITGVGCHFLLQSVKVKSEREIAQSCQTLHDPILLEQDYVSSKIQSYPLPAQLPVIFPAVTAAASAAKLLQSCPTLCNPIDSSPPRLPRPWDSPDKNTGVGCHFLLQCVKVKSESEVAQLCLTLREPR